ncbi:hypothetical protein TNCV_1807341 [Trichonephila clavipes]|nr:hypothetical protein TNCV_1807341 [Trichonephila clavipes]
MVMRVTRKPSAGCMRPEGRKGGGLKKLSYWYDDLLDGYRRVKGAQLTLCSVPKNRSGTSEVVRKLGKRSASSSFILVIGSRFKVSDQISTLGCSRVLDEPKLSPCPYFSEYSHRSGLPSKVAREKSDPIDDETDEDEDNNNESSKSPSNADAFSALETAMEWYEQQSECCPTQLLLLKRIRDLSAKKRTCTMV